MTDAPLAEGLTALARSLEPVQGDARSAAVWSLEGAPRLVYSGPNIPPSVLDAAGARLAAGEDGFDVALEAGAAGRVTVVSAGGQRAAYGLFALQTEQPHLAASVERLIAAAEAHIGKPVGRMSRVEKQQLVRFLDDRGAFLIRKAVESVADRLGVSRFTVYNYLDREGR